MKTRGFKTSLQQQVFRYQGGLDRSEYIPHCPLASMRWKNFEHWRVSWRSFVYQVSRNELLGGVSSFRLDLFSKGATRCGLLFHESDPKESAQASQCNSEQLTKKIQRSKLIARYWTKAICKLVLTMQRFLYLKVHLSYFTSNHGL